MLFIPETAEQARGELTAQLESATIEPAAAFARMLELDPEDRIALFELSRLRQEAGDMAAAEALCRRGLEAHPCDYRFYFQLAGLLTEQSGDAGLAAGLTELGVLKLLGDPDSAADAARLQRLGKIPAALPLGNEDALQDLAGSLAAQREKEAPTTAAALQAWRLIEELQDSLGNEMERELVDRFLSEGAVCRPLLVGVLRGLAQRYLPEGGELMAEASLALLGETGDPQSLFPLVQFAIVDDAGLSDIATWALLRIAGKRPAETVAALREFDRNWGSGERACIAETLASMPPADGKAEVLDALMENFGVVREAERTDEFVVIAAARLSLFGTSAAADIRESFETVEELMPAGARAQVDDLLKAHAADPSAFEIPPEGKIPSVYDICCSDRIVDEEDGEDLDEEDGEHAHGHHCGCGHDHSHGVQPHVRANLPGRNDPCWCGSGRKYKKCHLASDEAAQRN